MIKYLRDQYDELLALKNGITKNPDKWADHDITAEAIQAKADATFAKEKEADDAKQLHSQKLSESRVLKKDNAKYIDKVKNFVIAYHSDEPAKLAEYGISLKKEPTKKQTPSTKLAVTITDDTDGEGFILTTQVVAEADMYEWYKGESGDASKTDVIPAMTLFKITKKITFVDDDVRKGVRYFYKVRSVNSKGEGPWSEAVSRVQ